MHNSLRYYIHNIYNIYIYTIYIYTYRYWHFPSKESRDCQAFQAAMEALHLSRQVSYRRGWGEGGIGRGAWVPGVAGKFHEFHFNLRTFQQTPGAYPKPPTNSLWRNSFHLGVWGCLGYAPGVCWVSLRFNESEENSWNQGERNEERFATLLWWFPVASVICNSSPTMPLMEDKHCWVDIDSVLAATILMLLINLIFLPSTRYTWAQQPTSG